MPTNRRRNKPTPEQNKGEELLEKNASSLHLRRWLYSLLLGVVAIGIAYYYQTAYRQPGWKSSYAPDDLELEVFEVVDLPGKGKGMIATRDIKQGELIIREKPLFVVPHHVSSDPVVLISESLRKASPSGRQAFLNLSYVNLPNGLDPDDHPNEVALAIFQTNAVAAGDGVGIFPQMARLNHGCSSAFNVVYTWRAREQTLVVHALKDINKGEELLTTYTDTKRPRDQRRAFLADHYGFLCTCDVCSLPDAQSRVSDKRLQQISDKYQRFATWGDRSIDGAEAVGVARDIWRLEDEEGYWSERGRLAADAAWVAASHSDTAATREWADLAVQWYTYELGVDSELVEEVRTARADPRAHPAWGSREIQRVGGPSG